MSSKNSALASLTETYTDSENEEDRNSNEDDTNSDDSSETPTLLPSASSQSTTPTKPIQPAPSTITARPSKINLRLVSYNDDLVVSDEENVSPNRETINMEISEEEEDQPIESVENDDAKKNKSDKDKAIEYGFSLPAEPKGKCPQELQDKITHMYEKMKSGMDMNKVIQERKEFRNPSIYEKLIQFCDINELGTNYPCDIYDPLQWGKDSYYEELAKTQKIEMDKREKDRKDHMKQDQAVSAAKKAEEEAKKRKSKWDQPAPGASVPTNKSGAVVQASFTTNITGTKGTVISAFGSLPKKPKL